MDWHDQMREDIAHILNTTGTQLPPPRPLNFHSSSPPTMSTTSTFDSAPKTSTPTNTTTPIKQEPKIKQEEPISPQRETEARQVLRDLVPKFQKLNDLLIKAYEQNDLKAAEELRKRLNWAIGDYDGGQKR